MMLRRYMRLTTCLFTFWLFHAAWAQADESQKHAGSVHGEDDNESEHQAGQWSNDLETRIKQLQQQVQQMSAQLEQSELDRLLNEAEAEAPDEEGRPEEREFRLGALALQKLNPEITFFADVVAGLVLDMPRFYAGQYDRSGMPLRVAGLHFQQALDPYSLFKSAISFTPGEGAELEETYITWIGLFESISLTVGRFRQSFGTINRWHEHDLDQVSHPLALQLVLGEEGLVGNGISFKWFMPPLIAHANELCIEITDGENETLFGGEFFSVPSAMVHLKSYYDLTENTYFELGVTGMHGFNNKRGYVDPGPPAKLLDEPWRRTILSGVDLTIRWSPLQQAKYRSFTWRTEFFDALKEMPPETGEQYLHSWGLYSYIDYQLSVRWFCGVRFDLALPTIREDDRTAWNIVPYLTFWQSEFVYLRLQLSHGEGIPYETVNGDLARRTDNRVLLQLDFAAGPHKHEKY